MTTQKQITFTELKAKYTRDFDTFGKMDPFLEFAVGKCQAKTETANGAGKQAAWKDSVVLTYFDQLTVMIKSYDQDSTENEFMGYGRIEIKSLRFPGGSVQFNLTTDTGQNIGTVTGKYTIKNLNPNPLLLLKNFKCEFVKEYSFLLKSKPFIQVATEQSSNCSEPKQELSGLSISWSQNLRLRIKQNGKVSIKLLDKNDNNSAIFKYQSNSKEFKVQHGTKKFNVLNSNYQYLGTVEFDFQTINFVTKEQSVKNVEKQKKSENELTSILIDKVKLNLNQEKEVYCHFVIGSNRVASDNVKSTPQLAIDLKKVIYAQPKENKLFVVVWEKNLLKDKVIGSAFLNLEGLANGDKKVDLVDNENKQAGTATITFQIKQVPAKSIIFDNISVQMTQGADLIGESEPYVYFKIGGASNRTETADKLKASFKRSIELKYSEQQTLDIEIWEEDVTVDQIVFNQKVKLSELKGLKGDFTVNFMNKSNKNDRAKLFFKYEIKGNTAVQQKKSPQKKPSEPIIAPAVPQPKQIQSKAPEPKIQPKVQIVQQQPKVQQVPKNPIPPISDRKTKTLEPEAIKSDKKITKVQETERKQVQQQREQSVKYSVNKDTSRHRQMINLPSISGHVNFGDKIFDKQSAATLQKTILVYSMPKAPRFVNEPKYSGEPSYCLDSCFKPNANKGVGFGFGRKKQFPDWMERNMKQNPPPGAYLGSTTDLHSKGPTFGISHKYYEKVLIPKQKPQISRTNRKLSPIRQFK